MYTDAPDCDPVRPATQLKRLLGGMFATAIGWVDGAQLRLATCRDRVAHVCLEPQQGAFNVDTDARSANKSSFADVITWRKSGTLNCPPNM